MHSDAERKLAKASPCSFYASDKSIERRDEYQTKAEHMKVLMDPMRKRDDVVAKDESFTYWASGSFITRCSTYCQKFEKQHY
ncbi:hypothetical protein ANCCAN_28427 [Ancylostoma caninum]|uniref:Uncharacterized protein n=1 Tax=Ancylostoma caninum TaxID=29170 RepID=A0A368F2K0_ANCCA|nr:hypothetical protein ANCCAN_28427 [Ancylostoma caninum]